MTFFDFDFVPEVVDSTGVEAASSSRIDAKRSEAKTFAADTGDSGASMGSSSSAGDASGSFVEALESEKGLAELEVGSDLVTGGVAEREVFLSGTLEGFLETSLFSDRGFGCCVSALKISAPRISLSSDLVGDVSDRDEAAWLGVSRSSH
jgi:hypothetical protein